MELTGRAEVVDKLPKEIAEILKSYTEKASEYIVLQRFGKKKKAARQKSDVDIYFAKFKDACASQGILSEKSCEEIQRMLRQASGYTGGVMARNQNFNCTSQYFCLSNRTGDADRDFDHREKVKGHFQELIKGGEITQELAENLENLCYDAAWFAAHTIAGEHFNASRDKAYFREKIDKVQGKENQLAMKFIKEGAAALDVFPKDMADELKAFAEKLGEFSARCIFGKRGKAGTAAAVRVNADMHFSNFMEKCEGLLSETTCLAIRSMLWNVAWYAANIKKVDVCCLPGAKYQLNADDHQQQVDDFFHKIVSRQEITEMLTTHVKEMGSAAAWLAVNNMVGRNDKVVQYKAILNDCFEKVCGEVSLVAIKFDINQSKILEEKPVIVAEEKLVNNGNEDQSMEVNFSIAEGKTSSVTQRVGFSFDVKTSFGAGFLGISNATYDLSFNFSRDYTVAESTSNSKTKTYNFPLKVPKKTTYLAKAMVHEAQMDVPYELIFDFGGTQRIAKGRWKGVAVSKVTHEVSEKLDKVDRESQSTE